MEIEFLLQAVSTATTTMAVIAGMYILLRYLQRSESGTNVPSVRKIEKELQSLKKTYASRSAPTNEEMRILRDEINELKESQAPISDEQRTELYAILKNKLSDEAVAEVVGHLQEKVKESLVSEKYQATLEKQFLSTANRLKEELFSLSRRGNLNLVIGIMTTVIGLVLLGMFVVNDIPMHYTGPGDSAIKLEEFLIAFIPRISLVILIEIFALFFLKLYKSSIQEIKYFQNEITTIELKYVSLSMALEAGDGESLKEALKALSGSERNFVLSKDQTTIDVERAKLESQSTDNILGKLSELLIKKT